MAAQWRQEKKATRLIYLACGGAAFHVLLCTAQGGGAVAEISKIKSLWERLVESR